MSRLGRRYLNTRQRGIRSVTVVVVVVCVVVPREPYDSFQLGQVRDNTAEACSRYRVDAQRNSTPNSHYLISRRRFHCAIRTAPRFVWHFDAWRSADHRRRASPKRRSAFVRSGPTPVVDTPSLSREFSPVLAACEPFYLLLALGATQGTPSRVNEPRVVDGPD